MEIRLKERKGQPALFDGIAFLLICSFTSSIVYVAVSNYGDQENQAMNSAHALNYMQTVMKSMYYIDASQLSRVNDVKAYPPDSNGVSHIDPVYVDLKCRQLSQYSGEVSVADLLKNDLNDPNEVNLDDMYGNAPSPGLTAMRCTMKELMKPFVLAGYDYMMEVLPTNCGKSPCDPVQIPKNSEGWLDKITDVWNGTIRTDRDVNGNQIVGGCDYVQENFHNTFAVSAPFRTINLKTITNPGGPKYIQTSANYVLRICIWPSREKRDRQVIP